MKTGRRFADPRDVDFDSTVQEANIAYPSDAHLLTCLSEMGKKVLDFLKKKKIIGETMNLEIKKIKSKAREYFFLAKKYCNTRKH